MDFSKIEVALQKILDIDQNGYKLNSVLATASDLVINKRPGPLAGLPLLIKDNIEAIGLPATAGSLALQDTKVVRDSTIAKRLRNAGATIIGSTNLSEWANIRSSKSTSGWSAVGGLTANPWRHSSSAGGSSSGSGAAVSAGIVDMAVGSETDGSIICPSSLNGCVGIKPTVGSIPRDAMVPISASQDTPGPMARTVAQAALLLDVLTDKNIYAKAAKSDLNFRIAVVKEWNTNDDGTNRLFDDLLKKLSAANIRVSEISLPSPTEADGVAEFEVLLHEFNEDLASYLKERPGARVQTLEDVINFNRENAASELKHFGQDHFEEAIRLGGRNLEYAKQRKENLEWALHGVLKPALTDFDILLGQSYSPAWTSNLGGGDDYSSSSWITMAPAIAGTPIGCLPMGLVDGLPVGAGVVVGANEEEKLISFMAQLERVLDLGILSPTFIN
jgi:amidase